jgi:hypothetical protein
MGEKKLKNYDGIFGNKAEHSKNYRKEHGELSRRYIEFKPHSGLLYSFNILEADTPEAEEKYKYLQGKSNNYHPRGF